MFVLGRKSLKELEGVHPDLVKVVKRAIQITEVDFSVHDGIRTRKEQARLVRNGASRTMNSMHLPQPDGFGHAVDLVPYINGKLRWEWPPIYKIAHAVDLAAEELDVELTWGGVWDRSMLEYGGSPERIKKAVEGYVSRRRAKGKSAFIDGPHFQLA